MLRRLVSLGLLLGLAPALAAQATLQWKLDQPFYLDVKTRYTEKMKVLGQDVKEDQELAVGMSVRVLKKTPAGQVVLDQTIESISMTKGQRPDATMAGLKGAVVQLTVDKDMKISKVDGVAAAIAKLGVGADDARVNQLLETIFTEFFRYWTAEALVAVPAQPVKKGDTWPQTIGMSLGPIGVLKIDKQFTYEGQEAAAGRPLDKASFTGKVTYAADAKAPAFPFRVTKVDMKKADYRGTLLFDAAAGRLVRADIKVSTDMSMTLEIMGKQVDAEGVRDQTVTVRILDRKP